MIFSKYQNMACLEGRLIFTNIFPKPDFSKKCWCSTTWRHSKRSIKNVCSKMFQCFLISFVKLNWKKHFLNSISRKKIKVVVALFFTFPHLWPTQGGYLLTLYQVCLIEAVEVWPCFHVVGLVSVINII